MRPLLYASLIAVHILQPALGAYPTITANVNESQEGITYTYVLTNTSAGATVYGFYLAMPATVLSTITFVSGPTDPWLTNIAIWSNVGFLDWDVSPPELGVPPGSAGTFTIVTKPGVPTGYSYMHSYTPLGNANWAWTDTDLDDDPRLEWAAGNTVLPVPVPEPSSLLALAGGFLGLGGLALRRRRN